MARRKKVDPAATTDAQVEQANEAHHAAVAEHLPATRDIFDQAIAARSAGEFEPVAEPTAATNPGPPAEHTEERASKPTPRPEGGHATRHRPNGPARDVQPDPFPMEQAVLGEGDDAPRMRLYRHNRPRDGVPVMVIQFDEKPVGPAGEESKYLDMVRDAGFRWSQNDAAWKKPIDPDAKWRSQAAAEKVFREVANAIRQDRGLEAVAAVGM